MGGRAVEGDKLFLTLGDWPSLLCSINHDDHVKVKLSYFLLQAAENTKKKKDKYGFNWKETNCIKRQIILIRST